MEQIVKLTGRIAEVMPMQSGVSQITGNQWKSQEYLFEYFPWSGATNPSRIVVRIFGEEDIAKFNLQQYEQDVTLTLRFVAQKSQDGTRWFNEVRVSNVERPIGTDAAVAQQQTQQEAQPAPAPRPQVAGGDALGMEGQPPTNQEGGSNDLPF